MGPSHSGHAAAFPHSYARAKCLRNLTMQLRWNTCCSAHATIHSFVLERSISYRHTTQSTLKPTGYAGRRSPIDGVDSDNGRKGRADDIIAPI